MGVGVTSIQNLDRRVNIPCSLSLIPHPLSPFFFIFLRTLLHFFARQKLKSFLFVAFRTLDQKKNTVVGALLPLRARASGSGLKPHSLQLFRNQRLGGILPELERRPCNLGDPARIVVQSRKAGLKPNPAIQIVSLVPLLYLHNGVR